MKQCPMCGTAAEDEIRTCANCQYGFSSGSIDNPPADSIAADAPVDRPDGGFQIAAAYWMGLLALVLGGIGGMLDVTNYSGLDYEALQTRWWLFVAGGVLFQLALVAWVVGKLLHGMSFIRR